MSVPAREARKLEPGTLVEMYEIDLSSLGGPTLYYHPYSKLDPATFTFQGKVFNPWPIDSDGWSTSTEGRLPRPTITVGNINSAVSAMLRLYNDFVGAKVTRRQTFWQYIDGQPQADPLREFTPQVFYVNQRTTESVEMVQFELASNFDTEGVKIPRRQMGPSCPWMYRGTECGFVGSPISDRDGNLLTATNDRGAHNPATTYAAADYVYVMVEGIRVYYVSLASNNTEPLTDDEKWTRDECPKGLRDCKRRFGEDSPLPFGGFPGTRRIPTGP